MGNRSFYLTESNHGEWAELGIKAAIINRDFNQFGGEGGGLR